MNTRSAGVPGTVEGALRTGTGSAERHLTHLLVRAAFEFWGHFQARAEELGLAPTQAQTLVALEPGQELPMGAVADALACDPSTVTGIADRLEAQGLIERRPLAGDRRVRALALTEAGIERRSRFLKHLGDAPPSVQALDAATLRDLIDGLQKILGAEPGPDAGRMSSRAETQGSA